MKSIHSCSARAKCTFFGKKCAHFSALYYVNAHYVFLGSNLRFSWSSLDKILFFFKQLNLK